MTINELQTKVDQWIKKFGVRYYDIMTNTVLLMEEVGEASSLIARIYGEQSFKKEISLSTQKKKLEDELGDIMFVLTCIANQLNIDLEETMLNNLHKKTNRDSDRHLGNPKLGL